MSRSYHHGNLRAALIEAGAELARAHGPEGVVLREVARRTGVSHNAAYRHFSDREQLLAEIAALAMAQLEQAMRSRIAAVPSRDPGERARERLGEVGRAYVEFALAEPGLFEVAFAAELPDEPDQQYGDPDHLASTDGAGPYGLLNLVLDELVAAGQVTPERRVGADVACWAAVHGFSVLCIDGPLRHAPADEREAALTTTLEIVEAGLTAAGGTT